MTGWRPGFVYEEAFETPPDPADAPSWAPIPPWDGTPGVAFWQADTMTAPDPVAWLKAAIEARLEAAKRADTGEPWESCKHYDALFLVDLKPSAGPVEAGAARDARLDIAGCMQWEAPRFLWALHEHADHIAANDPQDTIARCEAELAILDEHGPLPDCTPEMIAKYRTAGFPEAHIAAMEAMVYCARCHVPVDGACEDEDQCAPVDYPCKTVTLLASGYRHRPGWAAHWGAAHPGTAGTVG